MQEHILLLFKFPEYNDEYFMSYTREQVKTAVRDANNFVDMYPGVLYTKVILIYSDEREECLHSWINPLSEKLASLANSVGAATSGPLTTLASAQPAGSFFQKLSRKFSDSRLALRPPSAAEYASPYQTTSKSYGGRSRFRTHRARGRRK